jgi:hypothetical protein
VTFLKIDIFTDTENMREKKIRLTANIFRDGDARMPVAYKNCGKTFYQNPARCYKLVLPWRLPGMHWNLANELGFLFSFTFNNLV